MKIVNIGSIFGNHFPRSMGIPRQFPIGSWSEFLHFMNMYNGKTRVFCSLYNSGDRQYIPFLWFDFDGYSHLENIRYYHQQFIKHNIIHSVIMSGGGFHLYVWNKPFLTDSSECFSSAKKNCIDEFLLEGYDETSIGDLKRIVGVPGTLNTKRGYFVTSLTSEQLELPLDLLLECCKKPNVNMYVYGSKLYDCPIKNETNMENHICNETNINKTPDEIIEKALKLLPTINGKFDFRFALIIYMFENLFTVDEIMTKLEAADPSKDRKVYSDRKKQVLSLYKKRFDYQVSSGFYKTISQVDPKITTPKPLGD